MSFGKVYEALVEDIDYGPIVDFIVKELDPNKSLLDAGCGTGVFLIPLLKLGFHASGIDLDSESLAIARDKMRENALYAHLYEHDLREPIRAKYDQIILLNDVVNYFKGAKRLFKNLKNALNAKGTLLFDVYKEEYLSVMDGYIETDTEPFYYEWKVSVHNASLKHSITTTETYKVTQSIYPLKYYTSILENLGMDVITLAGPDERKHYIKATLKK